MARIFADPEVEQDLGFEIIGQDCVEQEQGLERRHRDLVGQVGVIVVPVDQPPRQSAPACPGHRLCGCLAGVIVARAGQRSVLEWCGRFE
jgi:hypothetical protein